LSTIINSIRKCWHPIREGKWNKYRNQLTNIRREEEKKEDYFIKRTAATTDTDFYSSIIILVILIQHCLPICICMYVAFVHEQFDLFIILPITKTCLRAMLITWCLQQITKQLLICNHNKLVPHVLFHKSIEKEIKWVWKIVISMLLFFPSSCKQ
jgi:hypothetical protein